MRLLLPEGARRLDLLDAAGRVLVSKGSVAAGTEVSLPRSVVLVRGTSVDGRPIHRIVAAR